MAVLKGKPVGVVYNLKHAGAYYLIPPVGKSQEFYPKTNEVSDQYFGELDIAVRKAGYPEELDYCGNPFVRSDLGTGIAEPVKPNKYFRTITNKDGDKMVVDVYDIIEAFAITCPAISHAAKKVLCGGLRGHKDQLTDIQDVIDSMERAKQLHKNREVPFE